MSYFPLLIQYVNQDFPTIINSPYDIESGIGFKVLKTNYLKENEPIGD